MTHLDRVALSAPGAPPALVVSQLHVAYGPGTCAVSGVLDEPVAGMNPEESGRIAETVRLGRAEFGTPILLIEHDLPMVMSRADTVLVLDFGHVVACGTPAEVQADPEVLLGCTGDLQAPSADERGRPGGRVPAADHLGPARGSGKGSNGRAVRVRPSRSHRGCPRRAPTQLPSGRHSRRERPTLVRSYT